jgi:hypothetical protein
VEEYDSTYLLWNCVVGRRNYSYFFVAILSLYLSSGMTTIFALQLIFSSDDTQGCGERLWDGRAWLIVSGASFFCIVGGMYFAFQLWITAVGFTSSEWWHWRYLSYLQRPELKKDEYFLSPFSHGLRQNFAARLFPAAKGAAR